MFREAFVREGYDFDFMYDWNVKKAALKQRLADNKAKAQNMSSEQVSPQQIPQQIVQQQKISNTAQEKREYQIKSPKPPMGMNSNINLPNTQMLIDSGNLVMNG